MTMQQLYLLVPLAPLVGGDRRRPLRRRSSAARRRTGSASSAWRSSIVASYFDLARRAWPGTSSTATSTPGCSRATLKLSIGFLIDPLTATMMLVVTFVSLMVHVYTIGYMADDPGYTRFFSYISLFTFAC